MEIEVYRMYRFDTDRPLKAFADISVNKSILIKGVRVMQGKKGVFIAMPREQSEDSKWYDTVRCLTIEARELITKVVLDAYMENLSMDDVARLNKGVSNADNTEELQDTEETV